MDIAYCMQSTVHASSQAVYPAASDLNKGSGIRLYLYLYLYLYLHLHLNLYLSLYVHLYLFHNDNTVLVELHCIGCSSHKFPGRLPCSRSQQGDPSFQIHEHKNKIQIEDTNTIKTKLENKDTLHALYASSQAVLQISTRGGRTQPCLQIQAAYNLAERDWVEWINLLIV